MPDGALRIAAKPLPAPGAIEGRAVSPYVARLAWPAVAAATFDHYNVYCGASADSTIDQTTLVASPRKPALVDWGLKPGTKHYYRVTSVDRFGANFGLAGHAGRDPGHSAVHSGEGVRRPCDLRDAGRAENTPYGCC